MKSKKVKRAIIVGLVVVVSSLLGLAFMPVGIGQFRPLFVLPICLGIFWPVKVISDQSR